ncbi:MAG: prepilin-type N-terminal cleavage/methylation domain-containing protein [Verrucomicrobiae bacterium]|nr:prepilin-type N-terminal cleavage/methylation domain-containing protein [Verrucomicrobiae bacterium]
MFKQFGVRFASASIRRRLSMRRGFTLAEILAALLISGVAAGAVVSILFSCLKSLELHLDLSQATQRAEIALALIQPFVLNAGLGIPDSRPGDSMKANNGVPAAPVRSFSHPVQLAENSVQVSEANAAPSLWTVYSVPSGRGAIGDVRLTRSKESEIPVAGGVLDADFIVAGTHSMKSWVTFPLAGFPLRVVRRNDDSLIVMPQSDCTISAFDELYYIRAGKIFVDNCTLMIDRMDGAGAQAGVAGIAGVWFEFDGERRLLTARALARAEEKRVGLPPLRLDDWPENAKPAMGDLVPGYRYIVSVRSWRLRN